MRPLENMRIWRPPAFSILPKVVRTALQNAASIAGLLLTTDAAVTDAPEPKKATPSMPGGGEDYDY